MLDKKFNPAGFEKEMFDLWLENKLFSKEKKSNKKDYLVIIPPPNVTGKLHIGHAWNVTIQDALIRFKKMNGFNTRWIAGMDHAGIATQTKYEAVMREQNKKINSESREQFVKDVYNWAQDNANSIRSQWKKLGLALDYDNEYFTLDKNVNDNVIDLFVKMYNEGLIYRSYALVNWDVKLQTAISNVEVINKPTKNNLYYFRYEVEGSKDKLIVATTRPETMFADTCLVVNDKSKKYSKYIGKKVINPANNELIPIIGNRYVDESFGTGVMKCTPAHDFNDYAIGKKEKQKFKSCMNPDGTMNSLAGEFEGLDRLVCREKLVERFKKQNVIEKIETNESNIGYSERTGEIVEPLLSIQWFVKMKPLAKKVIELQKANKGVQFFPKRFEDELFRWLKNIDDWCISRQLKWGHQIPAWYHKQTNEIYVGKKPPVDAKNWTRDNDVFDTWFSSGSLPFSATGFTFTNKNTSSIPSSVLVTAYDILFFWVARMMMLTVYATKKVPFKDVLIHGIIRDEQNRKMSKSLGNGVDPMEVIDANGCDALRLFLLSSSTLGEDIKFADSKIQECKFFLNKLWNISLFVSNKKYIKTYKGKLEDFDKWIFAKLNSMYKEFKTNFEKYNFSVACKVLIKFVRDDFSSIYIELNKNRNDEAYSYTCYKVLKTIIQIIHPICPFVSEKIYQSLFKDKKSILIDQIMIDKAVLPKSIDLAIDVLEQTRLFKWENNLKKQDQITFNLYFKTSVKKNLVDSIVQMNQYENAKLGIVKKQASLKTKNATKVFDDMIIEFVYEVDVKENSEKLLKEKEFLLSEIKRSKGMLSNPNFVKKAPEHLVNAEKDKLSKYEARLNEVENLLK